MAECINVNLPRSFEATFPQRCVVCERDNPGSSARIVTSSVGWWSLFTWWWGKPFAVKAPACSFCAWKLQWLRFVSLVVMLVTVTLALWFVWPAVQGAIPRALQKMAMMGIALLCLLPQVLFEVFYARPFDVTAFEESVDYEFTSKRYAADFAVLNYGAEWVKIDGKKLEL